jgi:hypothetical protein
MAPSRSVRSIKVHVSRHNSQRIGPALTAQVERLAKEEHIRTDIRQPTNEPSSTIAQAIVRNNTFWSLSFLKILAGERL